MVSAIIYLHSVRNLIINLDILWERVLQTERLINEKGYFSAFYFPKVQHIHSHPIYFHMAKEIPSKVINQWRYRPVFDKGRSSCTEREEDSREQRST